MWVFKITKSRDFALSCFYYACFLIILMLACATVFVGDEKPTDQDRGGNNRNVEIGQGKM